MPVFCGSSQFWIFYKDGPGANGQRRGSPHGP